MEDPTNYRRKYEDAIKRAEKEILACGSLDCDAARLIYRIFSEEFISEDERIRKDLISLLNSSINGKKVFSINDTTRKQMIAWLEKQGKKPQRMVSAEAKEAFYGMKTPLDKAVEEEVNAWLEKQGEEKSQSDSKKLSEQIKDFEGEFGCWNSAQDFRPKHLQRCLCYDKYMKGVYCYVYDDISKYWCTQTTEEHDPDGDNHICDYADYRVTVWMSLPDTSFYPSKTLLDKQGEQNLVDKVEQKFKVGD